MEQDCPLEVSAVGPHGLMVVGDPAQVTGYPLEQPVGQDDVVGCEVRPSTKVTPDSSAAYGGLRALLGVGKDVEIGRASCRERV